MRVLLVNPRDFRAENGHLTQTDTWQNAAWAGFKLYPRRGYVKTISVLPAHAWLALRPSDGQLRDLEIVPSISTRHADGTGAAVDPAYVRELYEGSELVYAQAELSWGGPIARWLRCSLDLDAGQGPYYDGPFVGDLLAVGGELQLSPLRRATLTVEGSWERMDHGGSQLYAGWVGRAKLEVFATRELWSRLVVDHTSFDDVTSGQLLLAWQASPYQALFLGGGLGQEQEGELSWQAFAKLSWAWQR